MPDTSLRLKGRTAVVTGAGGGIGRALALKAAAEGMALTICDVFAEGLTETVELVSARGVSVVGSVLDVRDPASLRDLAAGVRGSVALVFANAGLMRAGPMMSQSIDDLKLMFDVNVIGVANTLQAFLPKLKAQAKQSRVVITGSQASFVSFQNLGGYCATKHALFAMAEALNAELVADGAPVGVSFIAPGAVATGIFGSDTSPNAARSLSPDRVAEIVFEGLARDRSLISTHEDLSDKIGAHLTSLLARLG
jgi:NAD(P)-dependent dehydrogenase (short-subunit alcohol dehydrogenase family)